MKNLYISLIVGLLASASASYSITETGILSQQTNVENPLKIIVEDSDGLVRLVLDQKINDDQGMLKLTDESGKVIFEEEVEILPGIVFKTFVISELQKLSNGNIQIELQTVNSTYNTTLKL